MVFIISFGKGRRVRFCHGDAGLIRRAACRILGKGRICLDLLWIIIIKGYLLSIMLKLGLMIE